MKFKVGYVYLKKQFANPQKYLRAIERVVDKGDFTLGKKLTEFEQKTAKLLGVKHVLGVATGTDALFLSLKALGIGPGDEVITAPNSFIATAATIALCGARPVFVDVRDDYTLDPLKIEKSINKKTKAILPVHLTGMPADMYPILEIAKRHNLWVVEDAAQAFGAKYDGKFVGSFGIAGAFSLHPLKMLHVWGDGGFIATNDSELARNIQLWRNHGLETREESAFFAFNSRLHTIHAAVALELMDDVEGYIQKRTKNAEIYHKNLQSLEPYVHLPNLHLSGESVRPIFTTQVIQVKQRQKLLEYLAKKKIEAVVQYETPIHLKKAAKYLGYKRVEFPICEKQSETIVTIPNHQYLSKQDILYVCEAIKSFYHKNHI